MVQFAAAVLFVLIAVAVLFVLIAVVEVLGVVELGLVEEILVVVIREVMLD